MEIVKATEYKGQSVNRERMTARLLHSDLFFTILYCFPSKVE